MSDHSSHRYRTEVLLNRALDDELDGEELTDFERLLRQDPVARRELARTQLIERAYAALPVEPNETGKRRLLGLVLAVPAAEARKRQAREQTKKKALSKPSWYRRPMTIWMGLAMLAAGGWGIWMSQSAPPVQPVVKVSPLFTQRFGDQLAILEALQQDLLSAAQYAPGPEMAQTHERLADDLVGALYFYRNSETERHVVAVAYLRTFHFGLLPAIQEGQILLDRAGAFRSRRHALDALDENSDSTLAAAIAITAYACDLLEGRTLEPALVAPPAPGLTLTAQLAEGALSMRSVVDPLARAELLNGLANRLDLAVHRPHLPPADSVRLQRMLTTLSTEGLQSIAVRHKDAVVNEPQYAELLKQDQARLNALQAELSRLPVAQREVAVGSISDALQSNARTQDLLPSSAHGQEQLNPAAPELQERLPIQDSSPAPESLLPKTDAQEGSDSAQNTGPEGQGSGQGGESATAGGPPEHAQAGGNENGSGNGKANGIGPPAHAQGKEASGPSAQGKANSGDASSKAHGKSGAAALGKGGVANPSSGNAGKGPNGGEVLGKGVQSVKSPGGPGKSEAIHGAPENDSSEGPSEKHESPKPSEKPESGRSDVGGPDRPDRGSAPDKPESPDKPDKPDRPDKPDKPDQPDKPDKPDKPEVPDQPDKPDKPDKPEKPDKPDKPGKG
ncbi:MAG: hypothetical protein AMXMBFR7_20980 [Planctomycetota bacterium]